MRLQRLTALESDKVRAEHAELLKLIELRRSSATRPGSTAVIVDELDEIERRHGDERRTEITHFEGDLDIEDVIADQQMVISITRSGYVKRPAAGDLSSAAPRRGRGDGDEPRRGDDYIEHLHICSTHDFMLFFTNRGKVYRLKVYELPEGSRTSKGSALVNVLLRDGERVMAETIRATSARASTWSSPPPRAR